MDTAARPSPLPWLVLVMLGVLGRDTGREGSAGASGRQGCGPAGASRWLPWLTDGLLLPGEVPRAAFHVDLHHRCSARAVGRRQTLRFTGWDLASPLHVKVGFFFLLQGGEEKVWTPRRFSGDRF